MKTLKQYFEAQDPVTGEAFADYCDRTGIGFQAVLQTYHAERIERGEWLEGNDPLLTAFEGQDPSGYSWAEYADKSGIGIRTFMATCERTGLHTPEAEKKAQRTALHEAWEAKQTTPPWWHRPDRVQPDPDAPQWWKKSAAVPPAPAKGPGPA